MNENQDQILKRLVTRSSIVSQQTVQGAIITDDDLTFTFNLPSDFDIEELELLDTTMSKNKRKKIRQKRKKELQQILLKAANDPKVLSSWQQAIAESKKENDEISEEIQIAESALVDKFRDQLDLQTIDSLTKSAVENNSDKFS